MSFKSVLLRESSIEIRLTYTAKIKYDKAIVYNREAGGVIKACTSRHHNVLFGIWWANITTIEGGKKE